MDSLKDIERQFKESTEIFQNCHTMGLNTLFSSLQSNFPDLAKTNINLCLIQQYSLYLTSKLAEVLETITPKSIKKPLYLCFPFRTKRTNLVVNPNMAQLTNSENTLVPAIFDPKNSKVILNFVDPYKEFKGETIEDLDIETKLYGYCLCNQDENGSAFFFPTYNILKNETQQTVEPFTVNSDYSSLYEKLRLLFEKGLSYWMEKSIMEEFIADLGVALEVDQGASLDVLIEKARREFGIERPTKTESESATSRKLGTEKINDSKIILRKPQF